MKPSRPVSLISRSKQPKSTRTERSRSYAPPSTAALAQPEGVVDMPAWPHSLNEEAGSFGKHQSVYLGRQFHHSPEAVHTRYQSRWNEKDLILEPLVSLAVVESEEKLISGPPEVVESELVHSQGRCLDTGQSSW